MEEKYLISDAAKLVRVESHVLRYWEEELGLPIQRNELGHRFYTQEDVERFRKIKNLKERGLQLRAIKMILKGGSLDAMEGGTFLSHLMFRGQEEKGSEMKLGSQGEEGSGITMECQEEAKGSEMSTEGQGAISFRITNEKRDEELSEVMREEGTDCTGGMAIEILEVRDLEKEWAEARRGEEYFKKLDQMLRDKSSADKKKRHFIF